MLSTQMLLCYISVNFPLLLVFCPLIINIGLVAGARVAKAYFKYCQNNLVLVTDVSWPSEV